MENSFVGYKKALEVFIDWYIRSIAGFLVTCIVIGFQVIPASMSMFNRNAEIAGHPSYISVAIKAWVPKNAIFGPFAEGGLSFHDATFSEMMAVENKFPNHFVDSHINLSNSDQILGKYYFKGDNATTAYRAVFYVDTHTYSNGWWKFVTKNVLLQDGQLIEKGTWVAGYVWWVFLFSGIFITVGFVGLVFFYGNKFWKKRRLANLK